MESNNIIKFYNKLKIYLDTSVISYLEQNDAPEKMLETRQLWDLLKQGKYDIYVSDIVLEELSACAKEKQVLFGKYLGEIRFTVIETSEKTIELAEKIINFGVLKQKSYEDCQHIAAAILAGCDLITSWNFKHIVNVKTIKGIKIITTAEGYKDLMIYPPTALLEEDE